MNTCVRPNSCGYTYNPEGILQDAIKESYQYFKKMIYTSVPRGLFFIFLFFWRVIGRLEGMVI